MSDSEPIIVSLPRGRGGRNGHRSAARGSRQANSTSFDRRELTQILDVYGRKVAADEWRDYAIDMLGEKAVFSVFRKTSEYPLFRIEKSPQLARRQGEYSVIAATGHILKRGHSLKNVLRVLEKQLRLVEA